MHRRSVSGSSTAPPYHNRDYAGPSRFRAEAEAQFGIDEDACRGSTRASLARSAKSLSEDQIVCQSKLYDAFELQELEQQLDRRLNFLNDRKTRPLCGLTGDQQEFQKSLVSVSDLLNDRPFPPDDHNLRKPPSRCACSSCKNFPSILSSVIDDSTAPSSKQSLITASNIHMQTDYLQSEAGCSFQQARAETNDHLQEEGHASYARRSFSMSRVLDYDGIEYAGDQYSQARPAHVINAADEALRDLQQVHADHRAISSAANVEKAHKQSRVKSSGWSLANLLFRSLRAMQKKQNRMLTMEETGSTSTSLDFANKDQQNKEYHHHHHVVHYHHVHHHHHHHVVNGVHFEEIDWPLSPARLQELGWLMRTKREDL